MDGWTDGWMNRRLGYMDGQTDGQTSNLPSSACIQAISSSPACPLASSCKSAEFWLLYLHWAKMQVICSNIETRRSTKWLLSCHVATRQSLNWRTGTEKRQHRFHGTFFGMIFFSITVSNQKCDGSHFRYE